MVERIRSIDKTLSIQERSREESDRALIESGKSFYFTVMAEEYKDKARHALKAESKRDHKIFTEIAEILKDQADICTSKADQHMSNTEKINRERG